MKCWIAVFLAAALAVGAVEARPARPMAGTAIIGHDTLTVRLIESERDTRGQSRDWWDMQRVYCRDLMLCSNLATSDLAQLTVVLLEVKLRSSQPRSEPLTFWESAEDSVIVMLKSGGRATGRRTTIERWDGSFDHLNRVCPQLKRWGEGMRLTPYRAAKIVAPVFTWPTFNIKEIVGINVKIAGIWVALRRVHAAEEQAALRE